MSWYTELDPRELEEIRPPQLERYLRRRGWARGAAVPGAVRWSYGDGAAKGGAGASALLQPLDSTMDDYLLNLASALEVLGRVEARSPAQVLDALRLAAMDVLRVRAEVSDRGSIAVEDGLVLLREAVDLLRSAARVALVPQPVLRGKPRDRVRAYLAQVRLGLPEAGSYVLRLYSPVDEGSPASGNPSSMMRPGSLSPTVDPFPRQVTITLMEALDAAVAAARHSRQTGEMDAFAEAVEVGVSSNLCRSLGHLAGTAGEDGAVEVSVHWAADGPPAPALPAMPVRVEAPLAAVLLEGGDFLRHDRPRPGYLLRGRVMSLEIDNDETLDDEERGGTVRVLERVDGRERRVRVHLPWAEYRRAIQAHEEALLLQCEGTLARSSKALELREPGEVEIVDPSGQQRLFPPEETRA